MTGGLPRSLMFPAVKGSAPLSYAINYEAYPSNNRAEYQPATTLHFQLPCNVSGQYLDTSSTYFKFSVQFEFNPDLNADPADVQCDALGHHFIQALTLTTASGSRQIEYISNYAHVHSVYCDLYSDSSNFGSDSICLNADPENIRKATLVNDGAIVTYCIPLISIIGTLSAGETMIPLCMLDSLKLSLQLATAGQALACTDETATANYKVFDPILNLQMVRLLPETQAAIVGLAGGNFSWSSQVIRTSEHQQNAGESFNSIALHGASFTSLKHLIASFKKRVLETTYQLRVFRIDVVIHCLVINSR
jgi:hypothetical protein